jgi:transcriptional regulator with XRE-family HTH domain
MVACGKRLGESPAGARKAIREGLDLSQEAFAERAGLGYKYYQSVEAGRKRDIRLSTLARLAKACGLELWQLLNFEITPALGEAPDKRGYHFPAGQGGAEAEEA